MGKWFIIRTRTQESERGVPLADFSLPARIPGNSLLAIRVRLWNSRSRRPSAGLQEAQLDTKSALEYSVNIVGTVIHTQEENHDHWPNAFRAWATRVRASLIQDSPIREFFGRKLTQLPVD